MTKKEELLLQNETQTETKSEQLIEFIDIKNSPFTAKKENGTFELLMGNNVVCREKFTDLKSVLARVRRKDWDLMLIASAIYYEHVQEVKQQLKIKRK